MLNINQKSVDAQAKEMVQKFGDKADDIPYLKYVKWDIISRVKNKLSTGQFFLRPDYKIDHKRFPAYDIPWIFTRSGDRDCFLYHQVCFRNLNFIHSRCHQCWKVVASPQNLEELFEVLAAQRRMNKPGKCGIENIRDNSPKLYGAYWYNNSLEEGKERYEEARKEMDKINPDMPVILKRACTEYEQQFGDSKDWVVTPEQLELEAILAEVFVGGVDDYQQTYHMQCHVKLFWIHNAYQMGDQTYLKFTGGEPLFRNLRTYHDMED